MIIASARTAATRTFHFAFFSAEVNCLCSDSLTELEDSAVGSGVVLGTLFRFTGDVNLGGLALARSLSSPESSDVTV